MLHPARMLISKPHCLRSAVRTGVVCMSSLQGDDHQSQPRRQHHMLSSLLSGFLAPYWEVTPSAESAIAEIESWLPEASVAFDHFAFRTFGVDDLGISSVSSWFEDLGYREGGKLEFPQKKLRAKWYSPPDPELPRIFVSELKVEEMSEQVQRIIKQYAHSDEVSSPQALSRLGPATGLLGCTPWGPIAREDYDILAAESEYAAWVLANGFALNHTTIAVHRLAGLQGGIEALNAHLQASGLKFNQEGGLNKISPDGLLLQSSTVADTVVCTFADGSASLVPGPYVEFAERLVLPEFANLKPEEIEEKHRRDGFEASSADKIFESTTVAARNLAGAKE